MRSLIALGAFGACAFWVGFGAAVAENDKGVDPQALWAKEIKDAEAHYATDRYAILKIDDAV